jgi:hypothetical protein
MVIGILSIMWVVPFTPEPKLVSRFVIWGLVALLAITRVREQASWRELGIRVDNFLPVLWRLLPFLLGLAVVLVGIGLAAGTLRFRVKSWSIIASLPVWAFLQQYLLLAFVHRRVHVLVNSGRRAVMVTTAIFAIMHLPNPALTVVCALGGFVWAREYDRSPNLFAHTLTHAIGSAILASSLPRAVLKNMVVGFRYFST